MGLSQAQRTLVNKAKTAGSGDQAAPLTDQHCSYLVVIIAADLGLGNAFPEFAGIHPPEVFAVENKDLIQFGGFDFWNLISRLFDAAIDSDTYFYCLAVLLKTRLKYTRILETQPLPTMEQVGPRALLQYGQMEDAVLAALLFWRKWLYDIDNRAAQETGYLFQPIIARAIGGASYSASKSPIRRHNDPSKGREVDCIRDTQAYEIKIRLTIAASGQGRWQEELVFPLDCQQSGYRPVLIVLDATPNVKLSELVATFQRHGGVAYLGAEAWSHLESLAGPAMAAFLEKYVRRPLENVLQAAPVELPDITFRMSADKFTVEVDGSIVDARRASSVNTLE